MFEEFDLELPIIKQSFEERDRRLFFSGAKNFRDLGGYKTTDGKTVRWGALYRSDHLHHLTDTDLKYLATLNLDRIIDFRAKHEKEEEPDRLPANTNINIVELPIMDSSTEVWRDSREKFIQDKLRNIDPAKSLIETNIELATRFIPQIRQFIYELYSTNGHPALFHCAAGKDRTGFAAAVVLRMLGVSPEIAMNDYLLSNQYYLSAFSWKIFILRLMKGKRFSEVVKGFLEVHPAYLSAAFKTIDHEFGSFENYVRSGLDLTEKDVENLRSIYLE